MRVLVPEIKPNGDFLEWRPTSVLYNFLEFFLMLHIQNLNNLE